MHKLGIIVGNRPTFPSELCVAARSLVLDALRKQDIEPVILDEDSDGAGTVRNYRDAERCARLFRAHRDDLMGIIATLPNFGDERGVADAIQLSDLRVPVLVHAFPDQSNRMGGSTRRDAFCGKISLCNNLRQYGVPFSLTQSHVVDPASEEFESELQAFLNVCRVVKAVRNARFGQIGARPAAFNTVRYSETLYQNAGITTETIDLSEVLGKVDRLADDAEAVLEKVEAIRDRVNVSRVPEQKIARIAKFGVVLDGLIEEGNWRGTAIQCWNSLQKNYGIMPCTIMSLLGDALTPSACETDISGLLSMFVLTVATGKPTAILDWNNNVDADLDKAVLFHCSNIPTTLFDGKPQMSFNEIISKTEGKDNSYGTLDGVIAATPVTFCRIDTDPLTGRIRAYVGRGELTDDRFDTFGGYGTIKVSHLQELMRYVCQEGFAHHVSVGIGDNVDVLREAFSKYLGWETHVHEG